MTSYLQGSTATLIVQWYEFAGGPASDVTSQTITITRLSDSVDIVGPTSVGITQIATGMYTYQWIISSSETPGDYAVIWDAVDFQSDPVQTSEVVTVLALTAATWATADEVLSITGVTVTAAQLLQANSVITIFANRTTEAVLSVRDLYWLKQATCWQAAWQKDQAGYTTRHAVTEVTQDGMQLIYSGGDTPNLASITLAPLAQRALKNTSWKGSRSARIDTRLYDQVSADINYRLETYDDMFPWQPL